MANDYFEVIGTSIQITGLEANTTYICQVSAVNAAGEGPESDPLNVTTLSAPSVEYTLNVGATAGGTTAPSGSSTRTSGEAVNLTAFPSSGYRFIEWQEGGVSIGSSNPMNITMTADRNITAVFELIPPTQYTLSITVTGQGSTSPGPGSWLYTSGVSATVTAIPASGWRFVEWQEAGISIGTTSPIDILMTTDRNITAIFEEVIVPPGQFLVNISIIGQGYTNPDSGSHTVNEGTMLTITAYAPIGSGWVFDHWEGDISGTANPTSVQVSANLSIVAVFVEKPPTPAKNWLMPAAIVGTIIAIAVSRRKK